jgi:hypothetical protein
MNRYVQAVGVVVLLIIVTLMLNILMPIPPCYFTVPDVNRKLYWLSDPSSHTDLDAELKASEYDEDGRVLLYVDGEVGPGASTNPYTYDVLQKIDGVQQVFIQRVSKNSRARTQPFRQGPIDPANHTLRCVLPISVSATKRSGIWVDGQKKFFTEKEWLIYDDSRKNQVFNNHRNNPTALLVVDIDRPSAVPRGISQVSEGRLFF